MNYLKDVGIRYEQQKVFKDLKCNWFLRYDFYLPEYNILIEYDGEQHFIGAIFGGKFDSKEEQSIVKRYNLFKTKCNDLIKNLYGITNGYTVLRIHYKDAKVFKQIIKSVLDNRVGGSIIFSPAYNAVPIFNKDIISISSQEKEITTYKIGASVDDVAEFDFGNITL